MSSRRTRKSRSSTCRRNRCCRRGSPPTTGSIRRHRRRNRGLFRPRHRATAAAPPRSRSLEPQPHCQPHRTPPPQPQPQPAGWQPVAAEGQWLPPGAPGSHWTAADGSAVQTAACESEGRRRRSRHADPDESDAIGVGAPSRGARAPIRWPPVAVPPFGGVPRLRRRKSLAASRTPARGSRPAGP